jgi:ribosomal protein L35
MKAKTHKATQKRFKLTAKGKLMHYTQGDNSHLKANKDRGEKARGKGNHALAGKGDVKKLIKLMSK